MAIPSVNHLNQFLPANLQAQLQKPSGVRQQPQALGLRQGIGQQPPITNNPFANLEGTGQSNRFSANGLANLSVNPLVPNLTDPYQQQFTRMAGLPGANLNYVV